MAKKQEDREGIDKSSTLAVLPSSFFFKRYFKYVLLIFAVYALFQFISGSWLYTQKVGLSFGNNLAYYKGSTKAAEILGISEEMLPLFSAPSLKDILHLSLVHAIAYTLLAFISLHIARSYLHGSSRVLRLAICWAFLAFLDLTSPFLAAYAAPFFAMLRIYIIYAFTIVGSASALLVIAISLFPSYLRDWGKA